MKIHYVLARKPQLTNYVYLENKWYIQLTLWNEGTVF